MQDSHTAPTVAVVGAGIVGLCAAYELARQGFDVTVFDPEDPVSQCSYGNAGSLSESSVAPLAMPGAVRSALHMLFDKDGPLEVPFGYWTKAAPWLMRFVRSAKPERVKQIADALAFLLAGAVENHEQQARDVGCAELVRHMGQMRLYPSAAALAADQAGWDLKRAHGLQTEEIDDAAIHELEPAIGPRYTHGLLLKGEGVVLNPQRYGQTIATALVERGASIVRAPVLGLSRHQEGWRVDALEYATTVDHVVIAAGAWSAQVLARLGLRVPLETQRGYHVQVSHPEVHLSHVVVLDDRKVFITPMEMGLRMAGTVEFGGLSRPMTPHRADLIAQHAREALPGLTTSHDAEVWMGHRPCLPDSLPVLGGVPNAPGLWCDFGHGHLGLTGSVNSARLLGQVMIGMLDAEVLQPFSIARFRR